MNAHVQNNTLNAYAYSLCCNSTNASITISTTCPGNDTVIRLSNMSNAHVELGNLSTYAYLACLGSNWKKRVEHIGAKAVYDPEGPMIV